MGFFSKGKKGHNFSLGGGKSKKLTGMSLLVSEYEELANRYGKHVFNMEKLLRRYEKAQQRGVKEIDFLEIEYEVLSEYRKKAVSDLEAEKADEAAGSDVAKEVTGDSASDKMLLKFEKKYHIYKRMRIHGRADKELEYLLGALNQFYEDFLPPLMHTIRYVKDKIYEQMIYEIEGIFYHLCYYQSSSRLPKVFNEYRKKLEAMGDGEDVLLEQAGLKVFKEVIFFLKKIKRLVNWLRIALPSVNKDAVKSHSRSIHQEFYVPFHGKQLLAQNFVDALWSESNKISSSFRLEDF